MFLPSPDIAYNCCQFAWWENGFTDEEIAAICDMGERQQPKSAYVGTGIGEMNENIRNSTISWIEPEGWLADKLQYIARQLNGKFFGLDLWGFGEAFQYTTYKYNKKLNKKQHYDWHMDQGPNDNAPRKLSLVLQLSDPTEYEGGDLEIGPYTLGRKLGTGVIFPAEFYHLVTPITKGVRFSLIGHGWCPI